jgi:DNA-binding CsgD family transcriptional regulator
VWCAIGDQYQAALVKARLAHAEAHLGDPRLTGPMLDEIESLADDSWLANDLDQPPIVDRAQAAKQLGDAATAVPMYERALAMCREAGDLHSTQMCLRPLGIMAGWRGDHSAALRLLAEAVSVGATLDDRSCTLASLAFVAYEAVEIGRPEDATRLLALLTKLWTQAGHRAMGMTGFDEAIERCRATLEESSFDAAWAEGQAMTREEGFAYAIALGDDQRGGLPPDTDEPVRARSASPLTPRETEVARLLARGLSNKQIAAELVVSERTVHAHVYRILGKLGLSSRSKVAAWAVANPLGG